MKYVSYIILFTLSLLLNFCVYSEHTEWCMLYSPNKHCIKVFSMTENDIKDDAKSNLFKNRCSQYSGIYNEKGCTNDDAIAICNIIGSEVLSNSLDNQDRDLAIYYLGTYVFYEDIVNSKDKCINELNGSFRELPSK